MAKLYRVPVERFTAFAQSRVGDVIAAAVSERSELVQLYKLASGANRDTILQAIQQLIQQLPEEDRRKWESQQTNEFTRLGRDRNDLFAARVKPRFWSRAAIRMKAEQILAEHGLTESTYAPPTPIEQIIEQTPDVRLHPSDSPQMRIRHNDGSPIVLGVTKWNLDERAQWTRLIEVNETLYVSHRPTDRHRLNYTLAHELWHAIEHLPLVGNASAGGMLRTASFLETSDHWTKNVSKPRTLTTDEDWQEWQADAFAAEIMMPHWSIRVEFARRFGQPQLEAPAGTNPKQFALELVDLITDDDALNEVYEVSRKAMTFRLLELGLVIDPDPDTGNNRKGVMSSH